MTFRVSHLKRIAVVAALAAVVAPSTAIAGKPEAKQFAVYLSGVLPPKVTPAESGRAEAKQIASYLSGIVSPQLKASHSTPAESSRAETKAFAAWLRVAVMQPRVTIYRPGGFDWGDAAVGAGATLGLVLLLAGLGAGLAISRQNHRQQVPST
jgi:hypothetical protein